METQKSKAWRYDETFNHVEGLDSGNCMVLKATPHGETPEEIIFNGCRIAAIHELYEVAQEVLATATIETPPKLIKMAEQAIRKADRG